MFDINDIKRRMDATLQSLQHEFSGLRTGRASPNLLDSVQVEAYGSMMPITQVGTVGAPEARLLTVQVWDKGMVGAVEKAIRNANLGLNPMSEGQLVRIPLPELSEERRKEMVKVAQKYAENARVAIRNIRRDGMDAIKKLVKDKKISEDDARGKEDLVQKETDAHINKIEEKLKDKDKEIMKV
ncbi:MAG: ribosome recycling factor [Proteobacteria bacterium]|nr:ribosome recycling factor [Pseudomonadota bacterium]